MRTFNFKIRIKIYDRVLSEDVIIEITNRSLKKYYYHFFVLYEGNSIVLQNTNLKLHILKFKLSLYNICLSFIKLLKVYINKLLFNQYTYV